MKISSVPLRLFFLIGILIATGVAARASDTLSMVVDSPFALTSKPLSVQMKFGRWFPVAVTLSNTGDEVSGRVTLELTSATNGLSSDASTRHIVAYADIDLPATSHKRVWLYSRVDSDNFDGAVVTFTGRGFRGLKLAFPLHSADVGQRVIVSISDSGERLAFLSGFTDERLADSAAVAAETASMGGASTGNQKLPNTHLVRPLGAAHDLVPDRWVGLESADMVVLGDFPHGTLAPEQIAAIEGYVAAGGTLLVPAGADWQRLSQSKLAEMWPVQPTGSEPATAAEISELVTRYLGDSGLSGADRLGGSPALLSHGTLVPGARKLAGLGATPLLATRKWGAGQVLWLAMDPAQPPFVGWRGQSDLWVELFSLAEKPHRLEATDLDGAPSMTPSYYNNRYSGLGAPQRGLGRQDATTNLEDVIHNLPQLRMPPTSAIAWFLAIYVIVLVPLNYVVLRLFDKREWAWITVPVIACIFSFASYAAARHIKGTELLTRHIDIVQGTAGTPLARTDAMLWMLTPRREYYNVSSSSSAMALSDYCRTDDVDNEACQNDATLQQGDPMKSFRLEDYNVPIWEQAEYLGQSVTDMGKGIAVTSAGGTLSVRNDSPFSLRGAVITDGSHFYRCGATGDLPRGTSVTAVRIDKVPSQSALESISGIGKIFASESKGDHTALDLAKQALQNTVPATWTTTTAGPMLVGWSTEAVVPLTLEGESPRAQNVSLFVVRLPGLSLAASAAAAKSMATRVVSREDITAGKGSKTKHVSYFDCTFRSGFEAASGAAVDVAIGARNNSDSDYQGYYNGGGPAPVAPAQAAKQFATGQVLHLEYRDARSGNWLPLKLQLQKPGPHQFGDLVASGGLDAAQWHSALRQPDNVIQIRTTCSENWDADNVLVRPKK